MKAQVKKRKLNTAGQHKTHIDLIKSTGQRTEPPGLKSRRVKPS